MPVNKEEIDQLQSDRAFTRHEIESAFTVIKNGADGNCLFYSVSQQMVGNQSKAKEYRQLVCDFYKTFNTSRQYPPDSLEEKIQISLIGAESHKSQVCKNLDWAQSPDIYVLVKLLNIRIIIFSFYSDRIIATPYTAHPTAKNERTLYIKYNGEDHYEALIPKLLPKPAANVTRKISPKKPSPKPAANVTRKISPKKPSPKSASRDLAPDDSAYLNHRFKLKNGREGVIVRNDAKHIEYNQTLLLDFDDGKKNSTMDVASANRIHTMVTMNFIEILSKVSEPSPKKPSPKKPSPKKPSPKKPSPKKPSPKKPSPSSNTTRKNSPKVGEGSLVGETIYKEFNGDVYRGTVVSYDKPYYRIFYEADGDKEEMTTNEVKKLMVPLIYR